LRAMGIRDKPTAPASPWQNGFAERLIGSIRRECLDHIIVLGEAHLRRILKSYADYYNGVRTHRSLNAPVSRQIQRTGSIKSHALLGGLHHHYVRGWAFGTHSGTAASTTVGVWPSCATSQISGTIKAIGSRVFLAAIPVAATNSSGTPSRRNVSRSAGKLLPDTFSRSQPIPETHHPERARCVRLDLSATAARLSAIELEQTLPLSCSNDGCWSELVIKCSADRLFGASANRRAR